MDGNNVKAIIGSDGKLLGISYGDEQALDRDDYGNFTEFMADVASAVLMQLPRDSDSEHAKRMIYEDNKRLEQLHEPITQPVSRAF